MTESSFLNPTQTLAAAKLHEGLTVADLGSGSGFFARAAARLVGEQGRVWALDLDRELLPRLKNLAQAEGLNNVEVLGGDLERGTSLPEGGIDFAVCANVLFALDDKEAAAAEVRRVLRRGGRVLVIDWRGTFGGLGPVPGRIVEEAEAKKLFESQHFSIAEDVPAGAYHWGFIARKRASSS